MQAERVYYSKFARLRVGFPPDVFGMVETGAYLLEKDGTPVLIDNRPVKEKRPRKSVQFGDAPDGPGQLTVRDPELIELLERHPAHGREFFSKPETAVETQKLMAGEIVLHIPAALTEEDRILIGKIGVYDRQTPPSVTHVLKGLREDFQTLITRFDASGVSLPAAERGVKALRVEMQRFLYALEVAGLWQPKEKDHDGRGSAESGTAAGE